MESLYSEEHRALQDAFDTRKLADFLDKHHVHPAIGDQDRAFIESRDLFFLSTVDPDGNPTVSYKGGPTGVVKVLGPNELAFPGFDGNGMFLSMATSPARVRSACCSSISRRPTACASRAPPGSCATTPCSPSGRRRSTSCGRCHEGLGQLPALHPQAHQGRAEPLRPEARCRDPAGPVEAPRHRAGGHQRRGHGRVAKEGVLDLDAYGAKVMQGEG